MKRFRTLSQSFLFTSAIALFGSSWASNDLVDTAASRGGYSVLVKAIRVAGLEGELKEKGPFTLFGPTDAAFAKLPAADLDRLMQDPAALRALLNAHMVAGVVMASDARSGALNTAAGSMLSLDVVSDGRLRVNEAAVVEADLEAKNGILHGIDAVILPT